MTVSYQAVSVFIASDAPSWLSLTVRLLFPTQAIPEV
jgi:hypothetical protein